MKVQFPKYMYPKTAIKLSIRHWWRMIRWAKKQNPRKLANAQTMYDQLHEATGGRDCALCHRTRYNLCWGCQLQESGHGCGEINSPYDAVIESKTWGVWVKNAEIMLAILKELR